MMSLFQEHDKHLLEVLPIRYIKKIKQFSKLYYRVYAYRDYLLTLIFCKTPVDSSVFSTISSKLVLSVDILNNIVFGRRNLFLQILELLRIKLTPIANNYTRF